MTIEILWRLATAGSADGRRGEWEPGDRPWAPAADARSRDRQITHYDYLAQVARAAELTGFDGLLIPDDADGEEPWVVASALLRETRWLKLLTTVTPGSASAVYHAKMAASLQRFSGGRQAWTIDLGPDDADERRRAGDSLPAADLVARAEELVDLSRGIWSDSPYDFDGKFFLVEKGALGHLVKGVKAPEIWVRGDSEAALQFSAAHGDVHLFGPAPFEALLKSAAALRSAAGSRPLRIAAEVPVVAREEEADLKAELRYRRPVASALTGTFDSVAERLAELADAGVESLVLSAPDQLREAYVVGEQVIPRLRHILSRGQRATA